jgi:hypothetical protein
MSNPFTFVSIVSRRRAFAAEGRDPKTGRFLPGNIYRFEYRAFTVCGSSYLFLAQHPQHGRFMRATRSVTGNPFPPAGNTKK